MLFEQGMKATATEPFHQEPWKKVEVLSSKTRQPTIQREALDPAYQKLIDQGVVSAPVKVDHKGFTLNGGNQWVSLAISGVTVPIPPNLTASIINNGNGNFAITWPSVVGARYVMEVSGNLLAWTPASGEISALLESTSLSVSSPLGVSTQFWRVIRVY
jgi:hypothetical protein